MDNTGDYISREAVVSSLNRLCDRVCQYSKAQRNVMCGACPLGDAFMVIEDGIPAADVRPVRRGKWIDHQEGRWIYAKCSECETVHDVRSNFCPNCGADMREES